MIPIAVPRPRHPLTVVAAGMLGAALVGSYVPVVHDLTVLWRSDPYYSYGLLIPLFIAFVLWEARLQARGRPAWWVPGLGAAVIGVGILAIGTALDSLALRTVSLPFVLAGVGLFVFGRDRFRPLVMPIAFLALMAPLPARLVPALSLPLQDAAAWFTEVVLRVLHVPVVREGIYVRMPDVTLIVSEACNGLRFLLAMIVVGIAFAWLTQHGAARRVTVLAAAIATAIAANWVRVSGTAVIAHFYGVSAASGTAHLVYGKLVYAVMFVPFLLVVLRLRQQA